MRSVHDPRDEINIDTDNIGRVIWLDAKLLDITRETDQPVNVVPCVCRLALAMLCEQFEQPKLWPGGIRVPTLRQSDSTQKPAECIVRKFEPKSLVHNLPALLDATFSS